jgi:signal transduction histidine kinase
MEAGRFSVDPTPESLQSIIAESRELLDPIATAKTIALHTELPDADATVHADRDRVIQVMSNLIGNAIKFTPEGGSITVVAQPEEGMVRISVIDTGVGIADENQNRIFDRFWHAGQGGGSGLGLAIAQGIVRAHRGRIWVESSEGGTRFHFTLPLYTEASRRP